MYALGQIPLRDEANSLKDSATEYYTLGDCVDPKNVYAANVTAYTIARDIGRF